MVIKLTGQETSCNSTPSNFSLARLIRVANKDATNIALVTHKTNSSVVVGSISIFPRTDLVLEKAATDTLESNSTVVSAVTVAYKN